MFLYHWHDQSSCFLTYTSKSRDGNGKNNKIFRSSRDVVTKYASNSLMVWWQKIQGNQWLWIDLCKMSWRCLLCPTSSLELEGRSRSKYIHSLNRFASGRVLRRQITFNYLNFYTRTGLIKNSFENGFSSELIYKPTEGSLIWRIHSKLAIGNGIERNSKSWVTFVPFSKGRPRNR